MRVRHVVGVVVCVVVGLTAGCSESEDGEAAPKPTGSVAPSLATPWAAFDPPTRFEPTPAFALGTQEFAEDVLLHGTNAFLATPTGVQPFDLPTQQPDALIQPERPPTAAVPEQASSSAKHHRPVLAEVGGRQVVVTPYTVTIPAVGTTQAAPGLDLVLVDAQTREPLPPVTIDFPEADATEFRNSHPDAQVIGTRGSQVVLSAYPADTIVVDIATRKVLWKSESVKPYAVLGDTVVSATIEGELEVRGLSIGDGATRWTALPESIDFDMAAIGPDRAVVIGQDYSSLDPFYALIDAKGKVTTLDWKITREDRYDSVDCRYDGTSVAVCTFLRGTRLQAVVAFDTAQGRQLWQLPDTAARRDVLTVTAIWKGLVYGQANAEPVILDARTGKDKFVPSVTPVAVNEYAVVAKPASPEDPIQVHRVTG